MKPFCTSRRSGESGLTLVELLVTITTLSVVVIGLCDVFIANQRAWDRQSGTSSALMATESALSEVGTYINNAMDRQVYTRYTQGDVLVICLPADMAYGMYVPTFDGSWGHSSKLQYGRGTSVVFYLSDSTGSYARTGNILWAGTMESWQAPNVSNVIPDPDWSLYPDTSQGRIEPVTSVRFSTATTQRYSNVTMTVTSSYKTPSGMADLTRTRNICLRSQSY